MQEMEKSIEGFNFSQEDIQKFLLSMEDNFGEDKNENEKLLKKYLDDNFGIIKLRRDGLKRLYLKIINDVDNFKFFKNESILNFDTSDFEKEINKLQKRSEKLEKLDKKILDKTEEEIKSTIEDCLISSLEEGEEKEILKKIEEYTGKIEDVEGVEFKQTLLQVMGEETLLLSLVVEINGKKLNVSVLKNKKTGEIKKEFITKADVNLMGKPLAGGDKESKIIKKMYDNPDAGFELNSEYTVHKEKFNLENDKVTSYENKRGKTKKQVNFDENIREQVKNGEKDEELNVFIQVIKEWNKTFKENKKELEVEKDKNKRKDIISKNAQKIANLFADNATLQGTVNFDNSIGFEGIKEYFEHFLALSPTMGFSKINDIDDVENGLLIVQGDYDFEVDDGEGGRMSLDANFNFYIEKNQKTGKWGIKRLKSTFGKTEDNLKEDKINEKED